jgi:hypothetical protein
MNFKKRILIIFNNIINNVKLLDIIKVNNYFINMIYKLVQEIFKFQNIKKKF